MTAPSSPIEARLERHLEPMLTAIGWQWKRQVRFGRYTADFLVETSDRRFVIECDGATYHDRTPEQATKDRKRDRWFLAAGIPTIRFSSSELFRNAEACAVDLIKTITCFVRESDRRSA